MYIIRYKKESSHSGWALYNVWAQFTQPYTFRGPDLSSESSNSIHFLTLVISINGRMAVNTDIAQTKKYNGQINNDSTFLEELIRLLFQHVIFWSAWT
jgi:hypothetical protein